MSLRLPLVLATLTPFFASVCHADDSALDLFEQRIMPIFRSPEPSSCIQCHLASVDLKDYILPSHEETFLSLRDQGLIDVERPDDSKILKLIKMGDQDRDLQAKRIHAKNRRAELKAFAAWIHACCQDSSLADRPPLSPEAIAKPEAELKVIRHARKDRVLESFVRNVWSQRMRCFPCHTPGEFDPNNPQHEKAKERYKDFVKKYGGRMDLFKGTPEETMNAMLRSSRRGSSKHLPMINFENPADSLLVRKPTSKVPPKNAEGGFEKPSSLNPVSHMGGLKMHVDDVSYKAVLGWIGDVAQMTKGGYRSAAELPADNWFPTKQVVRVKEAPESWPVGARVQLFLHAVSEGSDRVDPDPVAFTQGIVTPRHFVNGSLLVIKHPIVASPGGSYTAESAVEENGSGGSDSEAKLSAGRYVLKAYLDKDDRIAKDPTLLLGVEEFQGTIEMTAQWKEGFKNAEVVSAQDLSQ